MFWHFTREKTGNTYNFTCSENTLVVNNWFNKVTQGPKVTFSSFLKIINKNEKKCLKIQLKLFLFGSQHERVTHDSKWLLESSQNVLFTSSKILNWFYLLTTCTRWERRCPWKGILVWITYDQIYLRLVSISSPFPRTFQFFNCMRYVPSEERVFLLNIIE